MPVAACKIRGKLSPFSYWIHMEDYGMRRFVGLDVSLAKTSICVIREHGNIIKLAEAPSEPAALAAWLDDLDGTIAAVGLQPVRWHSGCIVT
jgi:hypothetical protein